MPFSSAPAAITARTGKTVIDISTLNDSSHSVAVLAAGSIRMVGLTSDGDSADYATVQLTATGQLDFNYSQDGISRLPAGIAPGESNDLTAQAYGNILASRIVYDSGSYNLSILSVSGNPNGRPYELAAVAIDAEDSPPSHTSVQALVNGTLLASASSDTTLSLVHFFGNGVLDHTFGDNGIATFALPPGVRFDGHTPLTLQEDGKLLLAGYSYTETGADFSVTRYNADGTLDSTFAHNGTAAFDVATGDDFARAVAVQADGKLLIAGTSDSGGGNYDFSVIRLNADGSLDSTFGNNGRATFDFEGARDAAQTITVLENGKILLTGAAFNSADNAAFAALQLNADGTLDTAFGDLADGSHHLDGRNSDNLMVGAAANDIISGLGGKDLLDGGAGRDQLSGGVHADVFRFSDRDDSYRTNTDSFSDRILDFDPNQDRLDLSALGFSGLGNGYGGTLAVQVDARHTHTYLKSFEADANGHRFELVLDGNLASQLNASAVLFGPERQAGSSETDRLYASNATSELLGDGGDDRLYGGLGNDILDGGTGRDILTSSAGADTYRFTAMQDSYRDASHSFSDRIMDFDVFADHIDVSALGFTRLGDGHNGTLAVTVSTTGASTYLKSYDANADGERFQLTLAGDLSHTLTNAMFVFAQPEVAVAEVELVGVAHESTH
ncbi:type I secretion target [Pseudomonas sp. RIT-PI-S]|uniref:M10 family metallopeptidase C-terminal domain-containing protein n=1 Tax=Pseudomonas sp. RIT-PI-S TaxID=3035295 RepID=UPI0021D82BBD|nr:type I secretion target [Pseudomonas sp. RIT-PI-S]